MSLEREPHWRRILASEVWHEEIVPMLEALIEHTRALSENPQTTTTLEQVRFLQGKLSAFREVLSRPRDVLDWQRIHQEREEERQS